MNALRGATYKPLVSISPLISTSSLLSYLELLSHHNVHYFNNINLKVSVDMSDYQRRATPLLERQYQFDAEIYGEIGGNMVRFTNTWPCETRHDRRMLQIDAQTNRISYLRVLRELLGTVRRR